MTQDQQLFAWGVAVCAPLMLNALTRRSADALGLAGMLVMIWTMSRVLWALYTPPESMQLYPIIDALAGATAFSAWMTRRAVWKLVLTAAFMVQCALHAAFWLAWPASDNLLLYIALNNALFALQLLSVAWPGGSRVAVVVGSWLPGVVRHHRHSRA